MLLLYVAIGTHVNALDYLKVQALAKSTSLSTHDFSTLNTTLPHNLIKDKMSNCFSWGIRTSISKETYRVNSDGRLNSDSDFACFIF